MSLLGKRWAAYIWLSFLTSFHERCQIRLNLDRSHIYQWSNDEALFIVLSSDIDAGTFLTLEEVLSNHSLALGHDLSFDIQQLRYMVVSTLVGDR